MTLKQFGSLTRNGTMKIKITSKRNFVANIDDYNLSKRRSYLENIVDKNKEK